MAASNIIIHLLPFGGAIILVTFYWTKYWIGGVVDNSTSLQFVAKLHEILMQASLVEIILYVVRSLALGAYIPLGALSGAAQAPHLSYLWSMDFLSAITAPDFAILRNLGFTLSVFGLRLMAAVVGPSTAVLMIPRAGMPHLKTTFTRYLDIPEATLFPSIMDGRYKVDFYVKSHMSSRKC